MDEVAVKGYVLDLERTHDDVLVMLAQTRYWAVAAGELTGRYLGRVQAWIRQWAKTQRLSPDEVDDAVGIGNVVFLEAVKSFELRMPPEAVYCSFATFLEKVIRNHFLDFCRSLQRFKAHHDWSVVFQDREANGAVSRNGNTLKTCQVEEPFPGPAEAAEYREVWQRLDEAVSKLDDMGRAWWEGHRSGLRGAALAEKLGITLGICQRLRRNVLAQVKEYLQAVA